MLKKAMQRREIVTPDGDKIHLQPDYTQKVVKQRSAFNEVRGLLRRCEGVRYGLFYPAELRITAKDGVRRSFKDPKQDGLRERHSETLIQTICPLISC